MSNYFLRQILAFFLLVTGHGSLIRFSSSSKGFKVTSGGRNSRKIFNQSVVTKKCFFFLSILIPHLRDLSLLRQVWKDRVVCPVSLVSTMLGLSEPLSTTVCLLKPTPGLRDLEQKQLPRLLGWSVGLLLLILVIGSRNYKCLPQFSCILYDYRRYWFYHKFLVRFIHHIQFDPLPLYFHQFCHLLDDFFLIQNFRFLAL